MKRTKLCLISLVFLAVITVAVGGLRKRGSGLSDKLASDRIVGRFRTAAAAKEASGKRRGFKTRQNRKGKKKNNRGRKGKKGERNKRRKTPRKRVKSVPEACFRQSVTILRMWKDSITNFIRQTKRMARHNRTGGNKLMKKGVFIGVAMKLLMLGGGDKTNLACAGSKNTAGARQLSNLTEPLHACQSDISRTCDPSNWPQPNMTFISECDGLVNQFKAGAQECLGKIVGINPTNNTDACSCWTSSSLSKSVESVKVCKASTEADAITAAVKNCSTTFSKCRKYEDEAIITLMACSSNTGTLIIQVKLYPYMLELTTYVISYNF